MSGAFDLGAYEHASAAPMQILTGKLSGGAAPLL